jgi:hypothetical protein
MMQDIRDEDGRLLLRYDPEACILEVMVRHYDNTRQKTVKHRRLVKIEPGARPEVLALPMTIKAKDKAA